MSNPTKNEALRAERSDMIMSVPLDEAQARLPELVKQLGSGDEVLITEGDETVARLVSQGRGTGRPRKPGSARGKLRIVVEDDEHLADFKDYMP